MAEKQGSQDALPIPDNHRLTSPNFLLEFDFTDFDYLCDGLFYGYQS